MTPPSTGEVMEALKRLRERQVGVAAVAVERAWRSGGAGWGQAVEVEHRAEAAVLALLEQYAPEICSRAEKEAKGIREVRVVLTVEEARALRRSLFPMTEDDVRSFGSAMNKVGAALRDLDEPVSLVEAKKEEES